MVFHDCTIELHNVSLRATPARIAVMDLLEHAQAPLDIQMIKDYLDEKQVVVDDATVFRIMHLFTQKGLTKQISFHEGKFRYELANKPDHHHLVCRLCATIEDFSDCAIPDLEQDIMRKKGFVVEHHSLEFYGLCRNCCDTV